MPCGKACYVPGFECDARQNKPNIADELWRAMPRQNTCPGARYPFDEERLMDLMQKLQDFDDRREGFAGEHWLVLAAGLGLWAATRKHPSFAVRTLGFVGGTALVGRAASGREGLSKLLKFLPVGGAIQSTPVTRGRPSPNTSGAPVQ